MRIPSGVTDQYIYFVAVDATDFTTRETGLSSFTVYRSRNGGTAAAMTTPTINETDTTNMPGVYELLLDEDMTIDSGDDSQEMAFHITHAGMAPVTRTIELYRPKITAGNTLGVAADGDISGNVDGAVASVTGSVGSVTGAVGSVTGNVGGNVAGSVGSVTGGINTGAGTITTLDGLDTAQDTQHSTTQGLIGTPSDFGSGTSTLAANLQDMADNGTASFDRSTDSLQAIRDRGDAAWITGPTAAAVRAEIDSNSTQLAAIVADTNELQTDLADGGRVDLLVDGIKAVTDALPDSGALTSLATAAALATVDGNVDTIVASTLSTGAAAQLEQNLNNCLTGTASGTPTTTTMVSDIAVTVDDQFKGRIITFDNDTTTAALRGQATDITACTAASNTLTFTALTTAPVSGDSFVIT